MKIAHSPWGAYCAETLAYAPRGWYAKLEHTRALYGIAGVNALRFHREPDLYHHPHWLYIRQFRLWLDGYRCRHCGTLYDLHVHHRQPIKDGGSPFAMDNLITLCEPCHRETHTQLDTHKDQTPARSAPTPPRRYRAPDSFSNILADLTAGKTVSTRRPARQIAPEPLREPVTFAPPPGRPARSMLGLKTTEE